MAFFDCSVLTASSLRCQEQPSNMATALRICAVLEAGFTMLKDPTIAAASVTSDDQLVGFEASMRRIFFDDNLGHPYTITVLPSYGECMVRTRLGEYDIGWAHYFQLSSREQCVPDETTCRATTVAEVETMSLDSTTDWTPYRCCVDYSPSPMSGRENSLVILSKAAKPATFFDALFGTFAEAFFVNYLSFLFIWVAVVAHLIWAFERRGNPAEFPPNYMDGIDDGIWWSFVTVTTVGYGDKCPKSVLGRILGIVWMIVGVSLGSILTGFISNRFVELKSEVGGIHRISDLDGLRVCSYPSVLRQHWLNDVRVVKSPSDNMAACGALLEAHTMHAFSFACIQCSS